MGTDHLLLGASLFLYTMVEIQTTTKRPPTDNQKLKNIVRPAASKIWPLALLPTNSTKTYTHT